MDVVRVGCRKNFVNADILVDEELPEDGILFELRRGPTSQEYSITLLKGQWNQEDGGLETELEESVIIQPGD